MARTRVIKPEFWDDEKLCGIIRDARLTFIGLWTNSDDYGVVKGHSNWLKSKIFPYDDIKIEDFEAWLDSLASLGLIFPFNIHGEKYYFIKHFLDHQKVDRPSKVRNPEPPSTINRRGLDDQSTNRIDETETETVSVTETETETETIKTSCEKKNSQEKCLRENSRKEKNKDCQERERRIFFEEQIWKYYPPRKNRKAYKEAALIFFLEKMNPKTDEKLAMAIKNFADNADVKDGIGIPDLIRFLCPKKNIPAKWLEWVNPEIFGNQSGTHEPSEESRVIIAKEKYD